jgi:hypothetical protein
VWKREREKERDRDIIFAGSLVPDLSFKIVIHSDTGDVQLLTSLPVFLRAVNLYTGHLD